MSIRLRPAPARQAVHRLRAIGCLLVLFSAFTALAAADDFAALLADRAAIERVYYQHRLGAKPPFQETMPRATLEALVRLDLNKETALKKTYGIVITPALLDTEVQRINTTTRAPEILAEIKAALGNDTEKFADAFAKPILVERLLRDKFDNDEALHAGIRRELDNVRATLINAAATFRDSRGDEALTAKLESEKQKVEMDQSLSAAATNDLVRKLLVLLKQTHSGAITETTWQLTPHLAQTNPPDTDLMEAQKRFGANARILSSPRGEKDSKFYFEDLPPELQRVLRVQLRRPGDVSAVIETPGGFLLYLAETKTPEILTVATLSLPKRGYEQWLAEENGGMK